MRRERSSILSRHMFPICRWGLDKTVQSQIYWGPVADPGFANGGPRSPQARVSRRRRRRVKWGVGREFPSPGVWGGAVPPPPKIFLTLDLKMSTSSAFWALFFAVQLPIVQARNTAFGLTKLAAAACMQCTAQRQQKAANTSLLESRSLLPTATLVFPRPRPIVCSRLSNNINILAKNCQAANGGGMVPPAPGWIRHCSQIAIEAHKILAQWSPYSTGGHEYWVMLVSAEVRHTSQGVQYCLRFSS